MKYNNISRISLCLAAMFFTGAVWSCSDDINISRPDESKYDNIGEIHGYLRNAKAPNRRIVDLYNNSDETVQLMIGLTGKTDKAVEFRLAIDESVLAAYNAENKTTHEMLPAGLVSFEDDGKVIISSGSVKSDQVNITIKPSAELTEGESYALPVSIKSATGGIELSEKQSSYIFYVKAQGSRMDATKDPDIKIISCMEVNDANPLTNGELYLKNSNKPFMDVVILFSANINFNAETGRVFVHCNPNVRALLDNHEKYLVPLQKKGIKVVLGILGNWDIAGVANLADETARYFAQELKAYCNAYDLDGIFFDDEYSLEEPGPGFVYPPSYAASSRLVYETKKAMPDKLNMVYQWSLTRKLVSIDGVNPGDYIDYVLADYGDEAYTNNYPGATKKQMCPYSSQFADGYFTNNSGLRDIRNEGYGGLMIFALDPVRYNWSSQVNAMNRFAGQLFDDELYWTGVTHYKDWQ